MRKLLFILFIFICLCNIGSCKKKHECVVSDEYKYNDTHHYKECSNAECENIFEEEEHHFTYSKDNKKCDLCSYEKNILSEDVESISIKTLPNKLKYYLDEELNLDGGLVEIKFIDGSVEEYSLSDFEVSGFDSSSASLNKKIEVSFLNNNCSFNVDICDLEKEITLGMEYHLDESGDFYVLKSIGNAVYKNVINIPETYEGIPIKEIYKFAFSNCTDVKKINFNSNIERINDNAFEGCSNLESVILSDSLIYIGNYAFKDCTKLTLLTIPSNVNTLGNYVFEGCTTEIKWNNPTIQNIGQCFIGYKGESIVIPSSVISLGNGAFSECTFKIIWDNPKIENLGSGFVKYKGDTLEIPNSVTSISSGAFADCSNLKILTIPSSVETIGRAVFSNCCCDIIWGNSQISTLNGTFYQYAGTKLVIPNSVTEIGIGTFSQCKYLKEVTLPDGLTTIAEMLFYNCNKLEKVNIPNSVTEIGIGTFWQCKQLKEVTLPDGLTTIAEMLFDNCNKLEKVNIPNSVTEIGPSAFRNCFSLSSLIIPSNVSKIMWSSFEGVNCDIIFDNPTIKTLDYNSFDGYEGTKLVIPNSVTEIGTGAFQNCKYLKEIILPDGLTNIADSLFYKCNELEKVNIPNSVTEIGSYAFAECSSLLSLTIPSSVTKINNHSFQGVTCEITFDNPTIKVFDVSSFNAYAGTSFIIPDSVLEIKDSVFKDCKNLKDIVINDNITMIPSYAFSGCSSLEKIIIPKNVNTIGRYAFSNCSAEIVWNTSSLTHIDSYGFSDYKGHSFEIPNTVEFYGTAAFRNCIFLEEFTIPTAIKDIPYGMFSGCTSLTKVTFHEDIKSIGVNVFSNCTSLETITIPSGVTEISSNLFENCSSLKEVVLPENITTIGQYAFSKCKSLEKIDLPESLTFIGKEAFKGCNFKEIIVPNDVVKIETNAFNGCNLLEKITIPFVGTEKNSGHDSYFDIIFGQIPQTLKEVIVSTDAKIYPASFRKTANIEKLTLPYVGAIGYDHTMTNIGGIFGLSSAYHRLMPDNIKEITITGGTSIEADAFSGCKYLTKITLPNTIKTIGDNAFYRCESLQSINIPSSVEYVGENVFGESYAITVYADFVSEPTTWHANWKYVDLNVQWKEE